MAQQQTPAAGSGKEVPTAWADDISEQCTSVLHLIPSEPRQALAVGQPCSGAAGGRTTITVEVYALGRGVAVKGQSDDLSCREGAFELETHGKPLVFDPLTSCTTYWQITPVQHQVGSVGLSLKAVGKEQLSEIGDGFAHCSLSDKAFILSLPQGLGKTAASQPLAQRLGARLIVEEWRPAHPLVPGALHLTNVEVATC